MEFLPACLLMNLGNAGLSFYYILCKDHASLLHTATFSVVYV